MTLFSEYIRPSRRRCRAFTLLELLVVLAILAVVATGIATTYGRKNIDEAKDKMTLHEMREIKKAFLKFETDNYRRLRESFSDHEGNPLPSPAFEGGFASGHVDDDALEAKMEFYETYGLWFLLQPTIFDVLVADRDNATTGDYRFPVFERYDGLTGEGWNGPYLDAETREAWNFGTIANPINFPQIADKHGGPVDLSQHSLGVYRLLYYEHDELPADATNPIHRRLLLVAPRGNTGRDELTDDELLLETGNLRGGVDAGRLNLSTAAFNNNDDSPFFVLELLNLDILPE